MNRARRSLLLPARAAVVALLAVLAHPLGAQTVDYIYDPGGQLVRAIDGDGNVLTYEYEFGGNLTGVHRSRTTDFAPPAVTSAPVSINADETVDLRIDGSNLLLAEIASSKPDLTIVRYRANDTYVLLSLQLPADTVLGPASLTLTTALGAVTYDLNVLGPRPVLFSAFPNRGASTGGTRVTLRGKNLTADTEISFGAQAVPSEFVGSTAMVVESVPGVAGQTADLTATNGNGTSILTAGFGYEFPFAVPGALGLTNNRVPNTLTIRLREPAAEDTILTLAADDPSVVALQESIVFARGEQARHIPIQGIVNGITRLVTSLGPASLQTAIFVTDPYEGPVTMHAAPVGPTVLQGALSNAVGVICLPRRLPNAMLSNGQSRTFEYPLPAPAGPGGLTLTFTIEDPAIASSPLEITVPEGDSRVQFTVDGLARGITRLAITGDGIDILIGIYIGTTPRADGPFLAQPVGTFTTPIDGTLAEPAGVFTTHIDGTLAPPVGAEVSSP